MIGIEIYSLLDGIGSSFSKLFSTSAFSFASSSWGGSGSDVPLLSVLISGRVGSGSFMGS